jgi:hypothetical protein
MLKALGRRKSVSWLWTVGSGELGKVKPHVLTQLFNISNECLLGTLNDLPTIIHDVVIMFSDDKHKELTDEQCRNYQKVLINL